MSSKESNVTGVIFDLFFMIKTRPVSGGKSALVLAGRWVSLKESNVTGVIFDLFFMIKTRSVLAGKLALVLAGGMGVSKSVKCAGVTGCHLFDLCFMIKTRPAKTVSREEG